MKGKTTYQFKKILFQSSRIDIAGGWHVGNKADNPACRYPKRGTDRDLIYNHSAITLENLMSGKLKAALLNMEDGTQILYFQYQSSSNGQIRYAGELLRRQKTKHRIFVMITDGCPEAPQYRSLDEAFSDVRDGLLKIQKDADVIGIGLFGDSMELKTLYENMFGKSFLSMDDISDLPSLISGRMKDIVRSW